MWLLGLECCCEFTGVGGWFTECSQMFTGEGVVQKTDIFWASPNAVTKGPRPILGSIVADG